MKIKNSVFAFAFFFFCLATVALAFPDPQSASGSAQQPGGAYQSGFNHGRADAQRNLPSNNQPSDQWTTDEERSAYRQGYDAGYSAASSATAPSASPSTSGASAPTASGSAQPSASDAERFGYQDGLAAGRKDHDGGHSFRPTEGDMYKNADHGWTADFGDRDHYRQLYRQAYARGYQEGFGSAAPR